MTGARTAALASQAALDPRAASRAESAEDRAADGVGARGSAETCGLVNLPAGARGAKDPKNFTLGLSYTAGTTPVQLRTHDRALCECGCGQTPTPGRRFVHGHNARRSGEERFWSKVDKDGPGGCWLWTAYVATTGYGRFHVDEQAVNVHRYAYELLVGPVPDGLTLDHLCRVRACINPEHLEPVTQGINNRRATNNPWRINRLKTHCMRGHAFDEANTYVGKQGWRQCRRCHADYERERQRRARRAA